MTIEIAPFDESMLEAAAQVYALRHAQDRHMLPGLPDYFDQVEAARHAVETAWCHTHTSGAAALENGRLVAYVFGEAKADTLRERHIWMHFAGHAVDPQHDPELYRDLYAVVGQAWLNKGYSHHFILLPAAPDARKDAWLQLGFAYEQVYALLSLADWKPHESQIPAGIVVRQAHPQDSRLLEELAPIIRRHQAGAPVWGTALPEDEQEIRQGYSELAGDPSWVVWLAILYGKAVGMQGYHRRETSPGDPLIPDGCIELSVAGTLPEARGRGVGVALTQHGLESARQAGYAWCLSDWRITNLLSSRFWPRRGFQPVAYRMVRHVDSRVLWAS